MHNISPADVAVCIVTYNQEKFIRKCIESVLAQKTEFRVVVRVGNDCSSDGTGAILDELQAEHPGKLIVCHRAENMGPGPNFEDVVLGADERYVAFLEGDNYWTDPDKLQQQLEILEADAHVSMCFHPTEMIYEDKARGSEIHPDIPLPEVPALTDLIQENCVAPLASMVVRRDCMGAIAEWTRGLQMGDLGILLMLATEGTVRFVNRTMAVQRMHDGGVWTRLPPPIRAVYLLSAFAHFYHLLPETGQKKVDELTEEIDGWLAGELSDLPEDHIGLLTKAFNAPGGQAVAARLMPKIAVAARAQADAGRWWVNQAGRLEKTMKAHEATIEELKASGRIAARLRKTAKNWYRSRRR